MTVLHAVLSLLPSPDLFRRPHVLHCICLKVASTPGVRHKQQQSCRKGPWAQSPIFAAPMNSSLCCILCWAQALPQGMMSRYCVPPLLSLSTASDAAAPAVLLLAALPSCNQSAQRARCLNSELHPCNYVGASVTKWSKVARHPVVDCSAWCPWGGS